VHTGGVTLLVFGVAGVLLLVLVVAAGTRMLRHHDGTGSGASDALGSFIDVFDPARARADRDLESREHQGEVIPSPGDDDRPVAVDLSKGTARVRRTTPYPGTPKSREP
jgi:hypothetical protein